MGAIGGVTRRRIMAVIHPPTRMFIFPSVLTHDMPTPLLLLLLLLLLPLCRYAKRHPVPSVELDVIAGNDTRPPFLDTPFGRIGGAICFDFVSSNCILFPLLH